MESINTIGRMATVYSHGRVVTSTRVHMWMMRETAMVKCSGQMAPYIKVNGNKVSKMALVK